MNQSTAKLLKLYCMNIDEKGHLIPQNQKMQIFKDWKNLFTHQSKTKKKEKANKLTIVTSQARWRYRKMKMMYNTLPAKQKKKMKADLIKTMEVAFKTKKES